MEPQAKFYCSQQVNGGMGEAICPEQCGACRVKSRDAIPSKGAAGGTGEGPSVDQATGGAGLPAGAGGGESLKNANFDEQSSANAAEALEAANDMPKVRGEFHLVVYGDGRYSMTAPTEDPLMCYGLLGMAESIITEKFVRGQAEQRRLASQPPKRMGLIQRLKIARAAKLEQKRLEAERLKKPH